MSGVQQIEIKQEDADQRLDRWFKRHFPALGHGHLEKLLRTGQIRLDGKRAKAADRVEAGQVVRVPPLGETTERPEQPQPRRPRATDERWAMTLRKAVLYKDDDVLVIDKPAGLAVQGGTGLATSVDDLLDPGLALGWRPRHDFHHGSLLVRPCDSEGLRVTQGHWG